MREESDIQFKSIIPSKFLSFSLKEQGRMRLLKEVFEYVKSKARYSKDFIILLVDEHC